MKTDFESKIFTIVSVFICLCDLHDPTSMMEGLEYPHATTVVQWLLRLPMIFLVDATF